MVRWRDEIGERRLHAGRGASLAKTAAGVGVFYALSILFNGASLHRAAGHMPYGPVRTASLILTRPLDWASRASGLNRVRDWIENTWNKETLP